MELIRLVMEVSYNWVLEIIMSYFVFAHTKGNSASESLNS